MKEDHKEVYFILRKLRPIPSSDSSSYMLFRPFKPGVNSIRLFFESLDLRAGLLSL